jgi:flagellar motor switch protein FliN/FliY
MTEQNDSTEDETLKSAQSDPTENIRSSSDEIDDPSISKKQDEEIDVVIEDEEIESTESDIASNFLADAESKHQSDENEDVSSFEESVSSKTDEITNDGDAISAVTFPQLEVSAVERQDHPELLNNVHVDLSVELGRKEMTVEEVSTMKVHDVIELSKLAGEAFEIRINGRIFAVGDVVIIGQNMAVRLTSMINHGNEIK